MTRTTTPPKNKAFVQNYNELVKNNKDPYNIMFAALSYDATSMILDAMKKNGPTSDGIKKYVDTVQDFDGVTGKLSFDKDHDVQRAGTAGIYVLEVKDGKYVTVK